MRILLVDDDVRIASSLKRGLSYDGYEVTIASNGLQALDKVNSFKPDVIILDVMMPEMDGFEACGHLRELTDAPILMLTAKDEVSDKVKGLGLGADDYMIKPYSYEELVARLKALARRTDKGRPDNTLAYRDIRLDPVKRVAYRGERLIELSTKEFDLMHLFMANPEAVLTREFLMDRVWGWDYSGESNVLEVYIRYLRTKLEGNGEPRVIATVRGTGYALRYGQGE